MYSTRPSLELITARDVDGEASFRLAIEEISVGLVSAYLTNYLIV